jgi:hypothetical protein
MIIVIARERRVRSSAIGPQPFNRHRRSRFSASLHACAGAPAKFRTPLQGSIAAARRQAEEIFGPQDWFCIANGHSTVEMDALRDGWNVEFALVKTENRDVQLRTQHSALGTR